MEWLSDYEETIAFNSDTTQVENPDIRSEKNCIRSYAYKYFNMILLKDPAGLYVFVYLTISSDSDWKMLAKNLTRIVKYETDKSK